MENLLESEIFCKGVAAGINIYQQRILTAHKHKEPIKIADNLFYLQSGQELLEQMMKELCR